MKDILLKKSLVHIPRLLGLIDRNKGSETYGCFDRMYWNYKKSDFPSGMAQLGVLPLALLYKNNFPGNKWFNVPRIKELCLAGIDFMEKGSHKDGSTDEFYPYERALGATSFTLYAATEAYMLLGEDNPKQVAFFKKRGNWLCKNSEPSVIANHQANAALALINVFKITGDEKYKRSAEKKIEQVFKWATEEGWFLEYEGCDPGYLTFTIDFLAKYYQKTKQKSLRKPIKKAIDFCSYFFHPDNSYAGEYGSRNTFHYLPHGFEIMGNKQALEMNNRFLDGLKKGKMEAMEDDVYFFLNLTNYLQSYGEWKQKRPKKWTEAKDFTKYFPKAQLFVYKQGKLHAFISLAKGGVMKIFKGPQLVYNDAGFIGKTEEGKTVTSQVIEPRPIEVDQKKGTLKCAGRFHFAKNKVSSVGLQIPFRLFTTTIGRSNFLGKVIKHGLIKKLITQKKEAPITFKRTITLSKGITIHDEIRLHGKTNLSELAKGASFSFITVPSSRYYQEGVLHQWIDLKDYLPELNRNRVVEIHHEVR